jgi:hypothetical protein
MPIIWDEGGGPQLTLRQKIIATLNGVAMAIVNGISEPIKQGIHNIWHWISKETGEEIMRYFGSEVDALLADPSTPEALKGYLTTIKAGATPGNPLVVGLIIGLVLTPAISAALMGPLRKLQMGFMRIFRPARPSYRDVVMGFLQGHLADPLFKGWLMDMGFGDDFIEMFPNWLRPSVGVPDLRDAYFRGALGNKETGEADSWLDDELAHLGYQDRQRKWLKSTFELLPTMANLVQFAVREAFTPRIAERFGQYEDFPELMMPWAEKIGMSRDIARMFWATHWTLPSPSQGFAMYHRGIISWEDLELLLKALDVMPFWRDKLLGITYTLPTRVDIRRMYSMKLISRDQAAEMYKKRGYSPEDTELQMTLADNLTKSADKDLTRADIINAYTKLGWEREEAVEMLAELGYDPGEIDYYLDYADYQRVKEYTDTAEKLIKTQYVRGIIDQTTANGRLAELGETAAQISVLMQLWTLEKEATTEHPSVSQLTDFYSRRIIAGPRLEAELSHLNYTSEYISWIHSAIDSRIAEENAKKSAAELRSEMTRHHYPTLSDLDSWLEVGIIDYATYRQRILDLGYSPVDADRFVEEQRRKLAGQPAFPSRADLGRWFLTNIISRDQYIGRMLELGYTRADIDLYLAEMYAKMTEEKKAEEQRLLKEEMARIRTPSKADLDRWLLVGLIDEKTYVARMTELRYSPEDIALYLVELTGQW